MLNIGSIKCLTLTEIFREHTPQQIELFGDKLGDIYSTVFYDNVVDLENKIETNVAKVFNEYVSNPYNRSNYEEVCSGTSLMQEVYFNLHDYIRNTIYPNLTEFKELGNLLNKLKEFPRNRARITEMFKSQFDKNQGNYMLKQVIRTLLIRSSFYQENAQLNTVFRTFKYASKSNWVGVTLEDLTRITNEFKQLFNEFVINVKNSFVSNNTVKNQVNGLISEFESKRGKTVQLDLTPSKTHGFRPAPVDKLNIRNSAVEARASIAENMSKRFDQVNTGKILKRKTVEVVREERTIPVKKQHEPVKTPVVETQRIPAYVPPVEILKNRADDLTLETKDKAVKPKSKKPVDEVKPDETAKTPLPSEKKIIVTGSENIVEWVIVVCLVIFLIVLAFFGYICYKRKSDKEVTYE